MENTKRAWRTGAGTALLMGVVLLGFWPASLLAQTSKPIRIGMTQAFFVDQPKGIVKIATSDFNEVLKQTTGLGGDLTFGDDVFQLVEKLQSKSLDFGIVHAHEFAWVQQKYPELKILLIAANKHQVERAYLVARRSLGAKAFADLRGKKFDLPKGSNEPCRAFLGKICVEAAKKMPAEFFGSIAKSESPIDALDQTARGNTDATVVDTVALEFYKEVKAAVFAKNLVILRESEVFPPAVILHRQDGPNAKTLTQFRTGLLKAHKSERGRDMMKEWNIEAFAPVPKDFQKSLATILQAYPSPKK